MEGEGANIKRMSLGSEWGPSEKLSHTWRIGGEAHTECRLRSGLCYLEAFHFSPGYCCRVKGKAHIPALSQTPFSGVRESCCFHPHPHTHTTTVKTSQERAGRRCPLLSPGGCQPHKDLAQEEGAAKLKL